MSKETILKEFDERFILKKHNNYVDEDSIGEVATGYGYTNEDIKQFISDIIDQTREETIREIEKSLNYLDENREEHQLINEVRDILNKLKK